MKHIRSALAAGLFLFGGALVASAQQPTPAPQAQQGQQVTGQRARHKRGEQLMNGINLSATEKANVKAVHSKYAAQLKALRSQGKTDAARQQREQIMTSERTDLRNALAPENQAKFDANVAQAKARMQNRKR